MLSGEGDAKHTIILKVYNTQAEDTTVAKGQIKIIYLQCVFV